MYFLYRFQIDIYKYLSSMALLSLRPIYTEELPGVAAHDSLFVLLRPGVAEPCTSAELPDAIKQTRIVRGYSWQLLSVDLPLQLRIEVVQSFKKNKVISSFSSFYSHSTQPSRSSDRCA